MNKKSKSRNNKKNKSKQKKNSNKKPEKSVPVKAESVINDLMNDHLKVPHEILFTQNFIVTYDSKKICFLCDCPVLDIDTHCNEKNHLHFLLLYMKRVEKTGEEISINIRKLINDWKIKRNNRVLLESFEILYSNNKEDNVKIKLKDFHLVGIDMSFEKHLAYCKKCDIYMDLHFEIIFDHLSQHKEIENSNNDKSKTVIRLENCTHSVESRRNGGRVGAIDMHVHKVADGRKLQISPTKLKAIGTFYITNLTKIVTTTSTYALINNEYCIYENSLFVLTKSETGDVRCEICLKTFKDGEEVPHKAYHINDIPKLTVLTELKYRVFESQKEFVRQVRPHIFHCGFCNKVEDNWNKIIQHSDNDEHYYAKVASYHRLLRLKSLIRSFKKTNPP